MRGKSGFLASLIVLVAGVVLILVRNCSVFKWLVFAFGILFVVASVVNVVLSIGADKAKVYRDGTVRHRRSMSSLLFGWISSLGCLALGIIMLVKPEPYVAILSIFMAVALLFGALFQFYMIAFAVRPIMMPSWLYLFPTLLVIGGIMILAMELAESVVVLITGVGFVLFSIGNFAGYATMRNLSKKTDDVTSEDNIDTNINPDDIVPLDDVTDGTD